MKIEQSTRTSLIFTCTARHIDRILLHKRWLVNNSSISAIPQQGTADAEIKVPSFENPELTNVLLLEFGTGQNIAMHNYVPTATNFFLV